MRWALTVWNDSGEIITQDDEFTQDQREYVAELIVNGYDGES